MCSAPGTRIWTLDEMKQERKWAIVTGASSGIGKALAYEFAAGGYNVFLTARNNAALLEAAADCGARYGVETDVFAADLSQIEAIDRLVVAITSPWRPYEVLVNNAGFGVHGEFASTA